MSSKKNSKHPQTYSPLILRSHRLMEAFAKSDDERDFYLDTVEGFIIYANLDKSQEELDLLKEELDNAPERFHLVPKLTFFETKKIMENFVHEKVYDIDTKEKLIDIIQSKEAREHFLEFIYDQHAELDKWQQFYQERSRIRIIEWLRLFNLVFVFEEDLDLSAGVIERLKENLFEQNVDRDLEVARKSLTAKAKSYYSNEALNPRPKRGRPPKQSQKIEMEPQVTSDIYTTVPKAVRPFLFTPTISSVLDVTFSSRFDTGRELVAHGKHSSGIEEFERGIDDIQQKLASLRELSTHWVDRKEASLETSKVETPKPSRTPARKKRAEAAALNQEEELLFQRLEKRKKEIMKKPAPKKKSAAPKEATPINKKEVKKLEVKEIKTPAKKAAVKKTTAKKVATTKKTAALRPARKIAPKKKESAAKKAPAKKSATKKTTTTKKAPTKRSLRPLTSAQKKAMKKKS